MNSLIGKIRGSTPGVVSEGGGLSPSDARLRQSEGAVPCFPLRPPRRARAHVKTRPAHPRFAGCTFPPSGVGRSAFSRRQHVLNRKSLIQPRRRSSHLDLCRGFPHLSEMRPFGAVSRASAQSPQRHTQGDLVVRPPDFLRIPRARGSLAPLPSRGAEGAGARRGHVRRVRERSPAMGQQCNGTFLTATSGISTAETSSK
jgi:hypothetical protein